MCSLLDGMCLTRDQRFTVTVLLTYLLTERYVRIRYNDGPDIRCPLETVWRWCKIRPIPADHYYDWLACQNQITVISPIQTEPNPMYVRQAAIPQCQCDSRES